MAEKVKDSCIHETDSHDSWPQLVNTPLATSLGSKCVDTFTRLYP
jgi:hypothetical protein